MPAWWPCRGARVGTSSLRRQCQLADRRPDLQIIRCAATSNTPPTPNSTREAYDAIILASAGLLRLGLGERIRNFIPTGKACQRSARVQSGSNAGLDARINDLLAPTITEPTASCVPRRARDEPSPAGLPVPIGNHATLHDGEIHRGLVGTIDGSEVIRAETRGAPGRCGATPANRSPRNYWPSAAEILRTVRRRLIP